MGNAGNKGTVQTVSPIAIAKASSNPLEKGSFLASPDTKQLMQRLRKAIVGRNVGKVKEIINVAAENAGILVNNTTWAVAEEPKALHYVCIWNYHDVLEVLLNVPDVDPNVATKQTQRMPLHYACGNGHIECVRLLCQHERTRIQQRDKFAVPLYYWIKYAKENNAFNEGIDKLGGTMEALPEEKDLEAVPVLSPLMQAATASPAAAEAKRADSEEGSDTAALEQETKESDVTLTLTAVTRVQEWGRDAPKQTTTVRLASGMGN